MEVGSHPSLNIKQVVDNGLLNVYFGTLRNFLDIIGSSAFHWIYFLLLLIVFHFLVFIAKQSSSSTVKGTRIKDFFCYTYLSLSSLFKIIQLFNN